MNQKQHQRCHLGSVEPDLALLRGHIVHLREVRQRHPSRVQSRKGILLFDSRHIQDFSHYGQRLDQSRNRYQDGLRRCRRCDQLNNHLE